MKRFLAILACVAMAASAPAFAQGNDNDYTPLGSRIKRDRAFPLDVRSRFDPAQLSRVMRERGKVMLGQFTSCLYKRSQEDSLSLLERTDFGFQDFSQIGLDDDRALRVYGFRDCLRRVATSNSSSVQLRWSAGALRQWLLEEAYLARYPEEPGWVQPGHVIGERTYPLSQNAGGIRSMMDFADCVVQSDPLGADYFYRATPDSADETTAINGLMPVLGPCLPQGQRVEMDPRTLRLLLGEGLWHAANNNAPAPAEAAQDAP